MEKIRMRRDGNHSVHMVDDGCDYMEIMDLARSGKIQTILPPMRTDSNCTVIVKHEGRTFLMKREVREYRHFDARLKYRVFGSPFLSVMKKVERAIGKGCDILQRIFLVDEEVTFDKERHAVVVSAWLLLDYLPGHMLADDPRRAERIGEIPKTIQELHRHKLILLDCHIGNFVVSEGKLKVIDLYFFSTPFFNNWPRAVEKVRSIHGLEVPVEGWFGKTILSLAWLKHSMTGSARRLLHPAG